MFIYLIVFPICSCIFIFKFRSTLRDPAIQGTSSPHDSLGRYGALYDLLATHRSALAAQATTLFLLRRVILAFTVVFLVPFPAVQVMILITTSMWMLAYQIGVRPYGASPLRDVFPFLEVWNEATLLIVGYLMIPVATVESR